MPSRCAPSRSVVSKTWNASPSGELRRAAAGADSVVDTDIITAFTVGERDGSAGGKGGEPVADGGGPGHGTALPGRQVEGHRRLHPTGRLRQAKMVQQQRDGQHGRGRVRGAGA